MDHRVPPAGDETATLVAALERNRRTFAWKCAGVDAGGLRATTAASDMTLAGLLKHLALVEDHYFTHQLLGRPMPPPWDVVDFDVDPSWEWRTALDDDPDELRELWRAAVRRSRAATVDVLADGGLDQLVAEVRTDGSTFSLRRVLVDMIEEYARHTGHADLLREAVDGDTGEGAPADFPSVT
jgi:uncharacterized damage-inducible protein DinB